MKKSSNSNFKNKSALIYPDISICEDCIKIFLIKVVLDITMLLTNCTKLWTRYSIIKDIPYDRVNTSLKKSLAYVKIVKMSLKIPKNRRYHAQAISCEECGPTTFYMKLKIKI